MNWLKSRFKEKSTQAALLGVVAIVLQNTGIDANLSTALSTLIVAFLFGYAGTEG
jgi:uncharacterized membrane protein